MLLQLKLGQIYIMQSDWRLSFPFNYKNYIHVNKDLETYYLIC